MTIFYPETDNDKLAISDNAHYAIYVVERHERELPDRSIPRYEIVNLATLAVEARVANFTMAIEVMEEFDRRLEGVVNGKDSDTLEEGIEYGVSSPSQIN